MFYVNLKCSGLEKFFPEEISFIMTAAAVGSAVRSLCFSFGRLRNARSRTATVDGDSADWFVFALAQPLIFSGPFATAPQAQSK